MLITFSWKAQSQNQKAGLLSDQVSSKVGLTLLAGQFEQLGDCEVLSLQTEGLGTRFPIFWIVSAPCWQKVEEVITVLKEFGIEALVLINGKQTILAYAAQEEVRARYLRSTLEMVRTAVKATRSWFKDKRIASIRQSIDRSLDEETEVVTLLSSPVNVIMTSVGSDQK